MGNKHFWSDIHLNHQLVADERGFDSVKDHDDYIMQTLADSVGKDDDLYLLGDLWIRGSIQDHLANLGKLPGRKILVFGNHCPGHPMHRRHISHAKLYADVFDFAGTQSMVRFGDQYVQLNHFPYTGDHPDRPDRHTIWRPNDQGGWLIHGHIHDQWKVNQKQINVGVDHWPKPATFNDISKIIAANPDGAFI